jgi:hypothetical protein
MGRSRRNFSCSGNCRPTLGETFITPNAKITRFSCRARLQASSCLISRTGLACLLLIPEPAHRPNCRAAPNSKPDRLKSVLLKAVPALRRLLHKQILAHVLMPVVSSTMIIAVSAVVVPATIASAVVVFFNWAASFSFKPSFMF